MASSDLVYRLMDAVRWLKEIASGLKYIHGRQPMVRGFSFKRFHVRK